MTKPLILAAILATLPLAGCATLVEDSSQTINFQAVGATDVMCDVDSGQVKYTVRPPQTITVKKSKLDLNLTCMAAGNRVQTMSVPSSLSGWTFGNIVGGGVIPGTLYDGETGAMFKYPEVVIIDFSGTVARVDSLPSYHAPDGVDPSYARNVENIGPNTMRLPGDDANALRRRMASIKHEREEAAAEAFNAERESRKAVVEGGWDGDKGGASSYSAPTSAPAQTYVPPSYIAPTAQPPVSTGPAELPQPVFPSTTSF